ncbi:MAG: hypothetical protein MI864_20630, partial [Pseudomonadales bacterium]|nr:hypothetical protein [Pseudomonadales bacterium]
MAKFEDTFKKIQSDIDQFIGQFWPTKNLKDLYDQFNSLRETQLEQIQALHDAQQKLAKDLQQHFEETTNAVLAAQQEFLDKVLAQTVSAAQPDTKTSEKPAAKKTAQAKSDATQKTSATKANQTAKQSTAKTGRNSTQKNPGTQKTETGKTTTTSAPRKRR